MLHTMPDKTVRVASRYPKGHGTVFFDLAKAYGFTLEQDGYNSDTLVLQAVGCYGNYTARYGDPVEAEADLADLSLMLADRHALPAASSVPALPSTQPSIALGHPKRRSWKGTMAGLVLGALSAVVVTRTLGINTAGDRLALRAADTARATPPEDNPSQGQGAALPYVPLPSRAILPAPAAAQQPVPSAALPAEPRPQLQPHGLPRPSASNFGLQP